MYANMEVQKTKIRIKLELASYAMTNFGVKQEISALGRPMTLRLCYLS